eukprot:evm.model.scf_1873.2 EVM.evm.TU.scf_1873.2   scf_1873:9469-11814(-)
MAPFLQHTAPQGVAASKAPAFVGSAKAGRVQAARNVAVKAVDRPVWYPGNDPPAHLDGSLPGDYGFDPLGLGSDPELLKWFVQAEIFHGRWAMTATAGILIPSIATKTGVVDIPEWYDAGKVFVENTGIPLSTLLMAQILLMNWAEVKRYYDFKNPGSQGDGSFFGFTEAFAGKGNGYPGGMFFDPFGLAKGDPETLKDYKVKEIKNGRLAMVAMAGFYAQYAATGKGPIDNLIDHIQSPYTTTFTSNGVSVPFIS